MIITLVVAALLIIAGSFVVGSIYGRSAEAKAQAELSALKSSVTGSYQSVERKITADEAKALDAFKKL